MGSTSTWQLDGAFWRWLGAASLVRAPVLMSSVAFTSLLGLTMHDPDRGGVLAGAAVLGMLLGTPASIVVQRRIQGQRLLCVQLGACAGCWLALTIPSGMVIRTVLAVVAGATMAGSAGLVRSSMAASVPQTQLSRASTIDALAQDAIIFLAPLAVSAGLVLGAAGAPLAVAGVAVIAIFGVLISHLGREPDTIRSIPDEPHHGRSQRTVTRWALWSLLSAGLGVALGAVEGGAVGLATRLELDVEMTWILFLVLGLASAVGAWLDITVLQKGWEQLRPPLLFMTFIAGCAILALDRGWASALVELTLTGLPTAALLGLRSHVLDADRTVDRRTGLTIAFAAQSIGFAVGAALLAFIAQPGALVLGTTVIVMAGVPALVQESRRRGGQQPR